MLRRSPKLLILCYFAGMRLLAMTLLAGVLAFGADSFEGKWTSDQNGNSGGIRLTLKPEPKVTFSYSGQDVACTVASAKVESESIEIAYDFILQGYKLRSTLKGTVKDGKLAGKYSTKVVEDGSGVDSGTFEGSPQ